MSIISTKIKVVLAAAALTAASTAAFAQDRYDRYDSRDNGYDDSGYEYARVVDVDPIVHRVRVSTPTQECWNETRYDDRSSGPTPSDRRAGGTLLGAAIGAVLGHQVGHGDGRRVATVAGAVIGGAIGRDQANRRVERDGYYNQPPQEYQVQRCETRYRDDYEERTDGYRVTYLYHGRRQVTELPYRPGDRIRVRVDVTPAE
jgi:uncharacterized protein YcfJ